MVVVSQIKDQGRVVSTMKPSGMGVHELCTACQTGDKQTVESLLSTGAVDVNTAEDVYGLTPLMYAMLI